MSHAVCFKTGWLIALQRVCIAQATQLAHATQRRPTIILLHDTLHTRFMIISEIFLILLASLKNLMSFPKGSAHSVRAAVVPKTKPKTLNRVRGHMTYLD
jgi:hypothetical protein